MTRFKLLSALAVIFFGVAVPACGESTGYDNEKDFTSHGKPDPINLPILCPHSPEGWAGAGRYPVGELSIGTRLVDPATLFARDRTQPLGEREAITWQVAAVLLNIESGDTPRDNVLVALGSLDDWLVTRELGDQPADVGDVHRRAADQLDGYFNELRPCNYDIHPQVLETDPRIGGDSFGSHDRDALETLGASRGP